MNLLAMIRTLPTAFAVAALGWLWVHDGNDAAGQESAQTAVVTQGDFIVRTAYQGKVESRHVISVTSQFQGPATIIDIATEGASVAKGDMLVRFDSTKLQRQLVNLEKDFALADTEYDSLVHAELPLEIKSLELKILDAKSKLKQEQSFLEGSITLLRDNMISAKEVEEHQLKIDSLSAKYRSLLEQLSMTRQYLHPAAKKRAQTRRDSAKRALALAQEQLDNTLIQAPTGGVVSYKPLHINGEFRTVRVGDSIYPNQLFMVIPDLDDLVVHVDVPEAELGRVHNEGLAFIKPLAYPKLLIEGRVESIASIAQNLPGRPNWQKYFHATIGLESADDRIRPGMSVTAYVLTHHNQSALLVPRRAVRWSDNVPSVLLLSENQQQRRSIELGLANETHYEVLSGLRAGDRVMMQ